MGVPGWLSRSNVQHLISARGMISGSWDPAPCRSPRLVWNLLEILSLPLSMPLPPTHACALSLSVKSFLKKDITLAVYVFFLKLAVLTYILIVPKSRNKENLSFCKWCHSNILSNQSQFLYLQFYYHV